MKKTLLLIGCLLPMSIFAANNLQSCTGCHGQNFEKAALGKSKIVKDMSKEDIVTALKGYKDGTYGGPMKGIMVGQVKKIGDVEHAAENIYNISHGGKPQPNKKKCLSNLKSIEDCVISATNKSEMTKCRIQLVKFAEKVKKMHNVKVD